MRPRTAQPPEHVLGFPAALAVADYVIRDGAQALPARKRRRATAARADADGAA